MIIIRILSHAYKRSSGASARYGYHHSTPNLFICLRCNNLRDAANNQVLAVMGLTLLATALSALFASFILGIFQSNVFQPVMEVRVMRITRIVVDDDKIMWDLMLGVRNSGGTVLEIPRIDLMVDDETIAPTRLPGTRSVVFEVMPSELRVLRIIIANHDPSRSVSNDLGNGVVVFSDKRFNSSMMVSVRIIDSRGQIALITFTLP